MLGVLLGGVMVQAADSSFAVHAEDEKWFAWQGTGAGDADSVLDMSAWLDAPAGRHGRIRSEGDQLIYNGRPIRLWGLNLTFTSTAPSRELADRRAAFYARYGINSVRLHKFADGPGGAGIQSATSGVTYDADGLDRMDYFVAKLRETGIFVKLSANFGRVKLGIDDLPRVPYAHELGQMHRERLDPGNGAIFFSRELQDLQIEQLINLLNHRNPYTGLTYAEDPAIAVVELINEDSALFYGTLRAMQRSPTIARQAGEQFAAWLHAQYGSEAALRRAWGNRAFNSFRTENLTGEQYGKLIYPVGNPWFFDPKQLEGSQRFRKQRLLDTMRFLYETQNTFHDRFVRAIRDTGYEGEILASNWQAGRAFSHFYNLHSDARIGMIDRHNYFTRGAMLRAPGSGSLSAGMQQVMDRPFMLSEWIHLFPSELGVEGPAIIGAYGMGLQGWDASYMFQNRDEGRFSRQLGDQWDVTTPQVMGVFPAVARQVLRGDVARSDRIVTRYVHVPSLAKGELGFDDRVDHRADEKELDSATVPRAVLAVARSVVAFTETPRPTPPFDVSAFRQPDGSLRASTGQLRWWPQTEAKGGHFIIDTPATQALVGFAQGFTTELADVTITCHSPFAAIYVTAPGPDDTLAAADRLLITTIARARNSGMQVVADEVVQAGTGPIRMEPVKAELHFPHRRVKALHVLDHDGQRTGRTIHPQNDRFMLDGTDTRTVYYEAEF